MLNKVMLIGNLGRDPELQYAAQSGNPFSRLSIGVNDSYTDRGGQRVNSTQWVNVTVFGRTAENCCKYLQKGSMAFIEGSLKTDSYEKNGQKMYRTYVAAQSVQFLSRPPSGNQPQQQSYQQPQNQPSRQRQQQVQEVPDGMEEVPF